MTACTPSEDPITPSGNYSVLRMEFPQGNNSWDEDIKEIHDKYGVYLLYKDITPADLNRKWTGIGTGNSIMVMMCQVQKCLTMLISLRTTYSLMLLPR